MTVELAMHVERTALGPLLLTPAIHRDTRGFFVETFHEPRYRDLGITGPFVQDNHSRSTRGTIRGLHWQVGAPLAKLVRVIEGEIFDVAVDIRSGSPTFGRWVSVTLSADNFKQFYVPVGFAHGFCVVSDAAQVEYKCTAVYSQADERGLMWNDPELGIPWPTTDPILSPRDTRHPGLSDLRRILEAEQGERSVRS
ncbi:MAG: dTDP-4-dehydrorhamnose 3,5-epimerase [Vicinamibacterales bacterium]